MIHNLFATTLIALLIVSSVYAEEVEKCDVSARPYRVDARYIGGKGIGYQKGYTTLGGFFTHPGSFKCVFFPFVDVRGHVFNDGKPAANAGLGLRYLSSSWLLGANAYYDYRKTQTAHYNQVSGGVECLGRWWDFRINGYFPVGKKQTWSDPCFNGFSCNHIVMSVRREFALKGANGEVGYHFPKWQHMDWYAAAGPYYLKGEQEHAWGGEGRLKATIFDYLSLQLSGSYDRIYRGIVQGQVGLNFAFGPKGKVKKRNGYSCAKESQLRERAVQPVDRFEIIVLDQETVCGPALNPCTGSPYEVIFVNNQTVDCQGTFEAPFPHLINAEFRLPGPDIIYVYPGDGTDRFMNFGIMLQNDQKFWSSSATHCLDTCLGPITIPQCTTVLPHISTSAILSGGDFVVELASRNEVSGFFLDGSGLNPNGQLSVVGAEDAISNASVSSNRLSVPSGGAGIAIHNSPALGLVKVVANEFNGVGAAPTYGIVLLENDCFELQDSGNCFNNITEPVRVTN